jgi:hypothetical protein
MIVRLIFQKNVELISSMSKQRYSKYDGLMSSEGCCLPTLNATQDTRIMDDGAKTYSEYGSTGSINPYARNSPEDRRALKETSIGDVGSGVAQVLSPQNRDNGNQMALNTEFSFLGYQTNMRSVVLIMGFYFGIYLISRY